MSVGASHGSILGIPRETFYIHQVGIPVYAMATNNTSVAYRFIAVSAVIPVTLYLNWTALTWAGGNIKMSIENVNVSTGQPSGIYDAAAFINFNSGAAGVYAHTFTGITTPLAVGTEYAITITTTSPGTTLSLASHSGSTIQLGIAPAAVLTGTAGSLAEVMYSIPQSALLDGAGNVLTPFLTFKSYGSRQFYSTLMVGGKFVLSTSVVCSGVYAFLSRAGTPASSFRCRIARSDGSLVDGADITVNVGSIGTTAKMFFIPMPNVTLSTGVYRVVFSSLGSTVTNSLALNYLTYLHAVLAPSGGPISTAYTTGGGDAIPSSGWTDTTGPPPEAACVWLQVDSFPATTGGGVSRGRMI